MRAKSTAASPCVLHGGWDPAARQLHIWGEVAGTEGRLRGSEHPFHLPHHALPDVLADCSTNRQGAIQTGDQVHTAWVVLPGTGSDPSPSVELQAELDEVPDEPSQWGAWRVDTVPISNPIAGLGHFDLKPKERHRRIRIGPDLEFWCRLADRAAMAVRRHEYLPAIHPQPVKPKRGQAARRKPSFVFQPGWEFRRDTIDAIAHECSASMPQACGALWAAQPPSLDKGVPVRDAHDLVRNFLAVCLELLIGDTTFTKTLQKKVEDTILSECLEAVSGAGRERPGHTGSVAMEEWSQWHRWRERIQRSASDADERVCFRLAEADPRSPDRWRLEWLLSSRRDQSLLIPLSDFWAQHARTRRSSGSVRQVLLQLGQAARIYSRIWDGMNSSAPSEVELTREEALEFLRQEAPVLQGAGFRVIVPAWWTVTGQRRLRLRLAAKGGKTGDSPGSASSGLLGLDAVLEFQAELVLDGKPLTKEEWGRLVAAKQGLVQVRGEWMELRADDLANLEEHWSSGSATRTMTLAEALRAEADTGPGGVDLAREGAVGQMLDALRNASAMETVGHPPAFVGKLREYQVRGVSWLVYLERVGLGACLADDMGLGKTVQVLASVLNDKAANADGGPTLLVAPTSVLGNWQREAQRFTPSLTTMIHHGPRRSKGLATVRKAIRGKDLVIMSFGVARLDINTLARIRWRRLVIDESQHLKNPRAAVTKAMRRIKAGRRVALTGTPVENRLLDLWSLFSVINPGYLGNMGDFRKHFERPIMKDRAPGPAKQLRRMVRPFILRRMKTDKSIIRDLPDKVEQNSLCNLTQEQASLYEAVVKDLEEQLDDSEGIRRQGLMLGALTRLKQICNHPAQFLQDGSQFSERRSHKLSRVCGMLDEIEAEGESVLVFTQFAEVGKMLERLLRQRYRGEVYFLYGGTPRTRREHMVERFQDPNSPRAIFVLSVKAGGTGITLTRANHVIHFDRWWNPAVENQATDRAYRIGQTKNVFVHKMVTMGTVEERIDAVIESKRQLAEEIVGSGESWLADLDNDSFRQLIALDRASAVV